MGRCSTRYSLTNNRARATDTQAAQSSLPHSGNRAQPFLAAARFLLLASVPPRPRSLGPSERLRRRRQRSNSGCYNRSDARHQPLDISIRLRTPSNFTIEMSDLFLQALHSVDQDGKKRMNLFWQRDTPRIRSISRSTCAVPLATTIPYSVRWPRSALMS